MPTHVAPNVWLQASTGVFAAAPLIPAPPVAPPPVPLVVVARAALAAWSVRVAELLTIAAPPVEPPPLVVCTELAVPTPRMVELVVAPVPEIDAVPPEKLPPTADAVPDPDVVPPVEPPLSPEPTVALTPELMNPV